MNTAHRLYVGTVGEGVFRSLDGGETFRRAALGMFVECSVRALAADPADPSLLYLGNEIGLYVSRNGADHWERLDLGVEGLPVWSLWLDGRRPGRILVGTSPARIFRSEDGGKTWEEALTRTLQGCSRIIHTRLTNFVADPDDPDLLYAGVEIDGVHRSTDGGKTWEPVGTGLISQDVHDLAIVRGSGSQATMLAATNKDLHVSANAGATWKPLQIGKSLPWSYCRALAQKPGQPGVVFLGNGDAPPGEIGTVGRSLDGGETWQARPMDRNHPEGRTNSTVWNFAIHPANPSMIYASSVSGQVYRSVDDGESWQKLRREFGEIRALVWTP